MLLYGPTNNKLLYPVQRQNNGIVQSSVNTHRLAPPSLRNPSPSPRKQTRVQKNAGREDLSTLIIYPSSALSAVPS